MAEEQQQQQLATLNPRIDELARAVFGGFNSLSERLMALEQRMTGLEGRIAVLEGRMTGVETRLTTIEGRGHRCETGVAAAARAVGVQNRTSR